MYIIHKLFRLNLFLIIYKSTYYINTNEIQIVKTAKKIRAY
jgi:hypothetical protein